MKDLLAFDLGASTGKAAIGRFNGERLVIETIHRFHNEPVLMGGIFYWDILRLFCEIKIGIAKAALLSNNIASVGVDTWAGSFALLDKNGRMMENPCHYLQPINTAARERVSRIVVQSGFMAHNCVDLSKRTISSRLAEMQMDPNSSLHRAADFVQMADLFGFFLSGEISCELTINSTTGMIDGTKDVWHDDILEMLGLPPIFRPPHPPPLCLGHLEEALRTEGSLRQTQVVMTAGHDTGACIAALPFDKGECLFICSGTRSVIGMETDAPVMSPEVLASDFNNERTLGGRHCLLKSIAGQWIIQNIRAEWEKAGESVSYESMAAEAKAAWSLKQIILPDHPLFRPTGKMVRRINEFLVQTGQNPTQSRGEAINCVNVSLALEYRRIIETLERLTGKTAKKLYMTGGGIQNRPLCQYAADATGREVVLCYPESGLIGNIMAQVWEEGEISSVHELRQVVKQSFKTQTLYPGGNTYWDQAYSRYLELYVTC